MYSGIGILASCVFFDSHAHNLEYFWIFGYVGNGKTHKISAKGLDM